MSTGEVSLYSSSSGISLRKLITFFYTLDEKSARNREMYAETLRQLNRLAEYRRLRIFAGNDTVPSSVWLVLLIGGVITVSYTYFFGMKNIRAQYLMTAALTVTITMILVLIYILDHPFTGANRVSAKPLQEVIETMQKQPGNASVPK
jgi:hypothetical protein